MKRIGVFVVVFFLLVLVSQGAVEVKFKGLVQTWFSYSMQGGGDKDGLGFSLRTVRLIPYGSFSDKVKWYVQVSWDKQVAKVLDANLDLDLNKSFRLRIGQFAVPGALYGALTSSSKLDFVERPAIIDFWSEKSALYGLRGLGLQVHGDIIPGKLSYAVMAANPDAAELFTPSIRTPGVSHAHDGLALWGRLDATPVKGLKLGAFANTGKEKETNIKRISYGANIFYVYKSINFKSEFIAGEYGAEPLTTKYNGMYTLLGYKIKKFEPIAEFDYYSPANGDPDKTYVKRYTNFILGLNYFMNDNIKLQANYAKKNEKMKEGVAKIKNDLFYICCQYTF